MDVVAAESRLPENDVQTTTPPEGEAEVWQRTIEKVIRSVVSIRFSQPHSFDGKLAGVSEATGFVVDAETGYILTNRHVVGTGPFWGRAVFHNQEEADAYPVYRDPVHDFGILRYDPKASPYIDAVPLELRPDIVEGIVVFGAAFVFPLFFSSCVAYLSLGLLTLLVCSGPPNQSHWQRCWRKVEHLVWFYQSYRPQHTTILGDIQRFQYVLLPSECCGDGWQFGQPCRQHRWLCCRPPSWGAVG